MNGIARREKLLAELEAVFQFLNRSPA